jgi:hypothetical protein
MTANGYVTADRGWYAPPCFDRPADPGLDPYSAFQARREERRNRARYDRSKLRYPSDVTDEEWELMVPLIPPGKSGGGKRTVIMREVVNGLMYVSVDRLSVARNPERPAAEKHGLRLF